MDFTLKKYSELLNRLIDGHYCFVTFENYCFHKAEMESERFVILRHDVDLKAENSLAVAKIEQILGVQASYYFRVVEQSNKPEIIKAIAGMGHEIGYHYEDMSICEGDVARAMDHFTKQLAYFRQYYPVQTICMHGSPRSKFDGKDLWKTNDYHNWGIIGEPYFDVDFSKLFYLTDTGRRWDGFNVSMRDKVPVYQERWIAEGYVYHTTDDIIVALQNETLPERLMITTHPQRWTDSRLQWGKEWLAQRVKNVVKRILISKNETKL